MKNYFQLAIFAVLTTYLFLFIDINAISAQSPWDSTDVDPNHDWTIEFNNEVEATSVDESTVYVKNETDTLEETTVYLNDSRNSITVEAPTDGYQAGKTYFLTIKDTVQSVSGAKLSAPVVMKFTILSEETAHVIEFKDKNIEEAIRYELGIPSRDLVEDDLKNITYLFTFAVEGLEDLHQLENITELHLHEHLLTDITLLRNLPQLTVLELTYSWNLTNIDPLESLHQLKELDLEGNKIMDISKLTGLTKLEVLNLSNNQVVDGSPLRGLTNLTELDLSSYKKDSLNQIVDLDFVSGLVNLKSINLKNNEVEDIAVLSELNHLQDVNLAGNPLDDAAKAVIADLESKGVEVIYDPFQEDEVVNIPDPRLEKIIRGELDKQAGDITVSDMLQLTALEGLGSKSVSDLTGIEYAQNVTSFSMYDNLVKDLSPLYQLKKLNKLSLPYNGSFTDLDWLLGFPDLKSLNLYANNISNIESLTELKDLEEVDFRRNPLEKTALPIIEELKSKGVKVDHDPIETQDNPLTKIKDIPVQTLKIGEALQLDINDYVENIDGAVTITATVGLVNDTIWTYVANEAKETTITIKVSDGDNQEITLSFQLHINQAAEQDTLYNSIYQALLKRDSELNVSRFTKDSKEGWATFREVMSDHPEFFYYQSNGSLFWSDGRFEFKYKFPESQIIEMNRELEQITTKIISENIHSGMSDFEKVKAIHDYVVLNTAYDYENYLRGTIPEASYTIYGLLVNKVAVCEGYALTMNYLLDKIGIDSIYVSGTANGGSHAWNKVMIDNVWYNLDATWDDPVPNREGFVRYNYFLIPDSELAKTHTWNNANLPNANATTYAYMADMRNPFLSGDYYYYGSNFENIKLYKIKKDGTDKSQIGDVRANELVVYEDWIYFSNYSYAGYLFKMKTDGTQLTKLNDFHIKNLKLDQSTLTYTNQSENENYQLDLN